MYDMVRTYLKKGGKRHQLVEIVHLMPLIMIIDAFDAAVDVFDADVDAFNVIFDVSFDAADDTGVGLLVLMLAEINLY